MSEANMTRCPRCAQEIEPMTYPKHFGKNVVVDNPDLTALRALVKQLGEALETWHSDGESPMLDAAIAAWREYQESAAKLPRKGRG